MQGNYFSYSHFISKCRLTVAEQSGNMWQIEKRQYIIYNQCVRNIDVLDGTCKNVIVLYFWS